MNNHPATSDSPAPTAAKMTRKQAAANALGLQRAEGLEPSPEHEALAARWVAGEIDSEQFKQLNLEQVRQRLAGSANMQHPIDPEQLLAAAEVLAPDKPKEGPVSFTKTRRAVSTTRLVALHERAELRADPFGDLRPRLPAGLDDQLDRAGDARPLALIGPGLAWHSRSRS